MMLFQNDAANWGVVAAVAYDVLTLGLLAIGGYTLRSALRQAGQDRESTTKQLAEMEKGRKEALLPKLIAAEGERSTAGHISVLIRNVGPGPAIGCHLTVALENMPGEGGDLFVRGSAHVCVSQRLHRGPIDKVFEFSAIESGGERSLKWTGEPLGTYSGWKLGMCLAKFHDVYGQYHEAYSLFELAPVGK